MYVPCMDEEVQALLDEYEKSGDPDIADHLIESLDVTRRARLEESTVAESFLEVPWLFFSYLFSLIDLSTWTI